MSNDVATRMQRELSTEGTDAVTRSEETQTAQSGTYRGPDRRKPSFRSILYGMFNPRRRRVGRSDDLKNAFLDWHPNRLLVVATAILILSVIDGLLTVRLVNAGVHEINPLLAGLVSNSAAGFAIVKWALSATGVIALVVAAHARVFGLVRGGALLYAVLVGYSMLVLYSLALVQSLS